MAIGYHKLHLNALFLLPTVTLLSSFGTNIGEPTTSLYVYSCEPRSLLIDLQLYPQLLCGPTNRDATDARDAIHSNCTVSFIRKRKGPPPIRPHEFSIRFGGAVRQL